MVLDPDLLPDIRALDLGPPRKEAIEYSPAKPGAICLAYVSNVDEDGNEVGGFACPI